MRRGGVCRAHGQVARTGNLERHASDFVSSEHACPGSFIRLDHPARRMAESVLPAHAENYEVRPHGLDEAPA
jgi:hypothetical protein